jgi:sterol desaturase/sphingolipid hydroxylase (fatty acid hydroxylase superfamily)
MALMAEDTIMDFQPQLILIYFIPVFAVFMAAELVWLRAQGAGHPESADYTLKDTISNGFLALFHEIGDGIAALVVISIYYSLFDFRLFTIPNSAWAFLLLFLLQDFLYYWFHRASHRIRWMWASHVVHHSSEKLNFSTAFRQSLTYPISGMWVFWLPLIALGFDPMTVIMVVLLNLAYQFFLHTQVVDKLGVLEGILNTPSHHRVHHARNEQYIDKNYAGTLIIWDKLFGTFVEERDDLPCDYGITRQIDTHNPIELTFHEWKDMFADVFNAENGLAGGIKHLWMPPEWQPEVSQSRSVV